MLAASQERLATGSPFAWVTLVAVRGSAPQVVGAKALVEPAGLVAGTVGGGRLEAHALRTAVKLLEGAEACLLETVNLQKELGMSCGGEVTLLYECVRPAAWELVVFGAGHVAQALVRLLATLECRVSVFDTRPEWVRRVPVAPGVNARCVPELAAQVKELPEGAYIVVMTQGHTTDLPVLRAALAWGRYRYLGVLGSAVKAARVRRELRAAGCDEAAVAALRCPVGLPLGRSVPAEIAISVAAELLQERGAAAEQGAP